MPSAESANDSFSLISNFQVFSSLTDHRRLHLRWRWNSTTLAEQLFQQANVFYYSGGDINVSGEQPIHDPSLQSYDLFELQADTQYTICLRVTRKRYDRAVEEAKKLQLQATPTALQELSIKNNITKLDVKPSSEAYVAEMQCRVAVTRLVHWSAVISVFTGILIACLIALSIVLLLKRIQVKRDMRKTETFHQNVQLLGSKVEKNEEAARQTDKYTCFLHSKTEAVNSGVCETGLVRKDSLMFVAVNAPYQSAIKSRAASNDASISEFLSTSGSGSNQFSSPSSNLDTHSDNRKHGRHQRKPDPVKHTSSAVSTDTPSLSDTHDRKGQHKRTVSFVVSDRKKRDSKRTSDSVIRLPRQTNTSPQLSETHVGNGFADLSDTVALSDGTNKRTPSALYPVEIVKPTSVMKEPTPSVDSGQELHVPYSFVSNKTDFPIGSRMEVREKQFTDKTALLSPELGDGDVSATSSLMDSNGSFDPRPVTTTDTQTVITLSHDKTELDAKNELSVPCSVRAATEADSFPATLYRLISMGVEETDKINSVPSVTGVAVQQEYPTVDDADNSSFFYTQVVESL
ncbi:hypothetical protein T265_05055 [Opisthorchis viverrini]|uniref:Fibronectin type-III domain-containing protein n=1 Tax=Opisthorchis viverrini TaxID=6198 RepID=A0A074ZKX9_OPIVI|nr:hypothetical protein T265_05055 [Opisthorchis viverrini]KER28008.1 hypothetical protein T265_05055 [Opisthorchis viverrini]